MVAILMFESLNRWRLLRLADCQYHDQFCGLLLRVAVRNECFLLKKLVFRLWILLALVLYCYCLASFCHVLKMFYGDTVNLLQIQKQNLVKDTATMTNCCATSPFMQLAQGVGRNFFASYSTACVVIIITLLVAVPLLSEMFNVNLANIQTIVFPILAVALFYLPRQKKQRIPMGLAILALLCWLFSALHVRGLLSDIINPPEIIVTSLRGDPDDIEARAFKRAYYRQGRGRLNPTIGLRQGSYNDVQSLSRWGFRSADTSIVITGDKFWPKIALSNNRIKRISGVGSFFSQSNQAQFSEWLRRASEFYRLNIGENFFPVELLGVDFQLIGVLLPGEVSNPMQDEDLLAAWLAEVVSAVGKNVPDYISASSSPIELLQARREMLVSASMMPGRWKSPAALGLSRFLGGTFGLVAATQSLELSSKQCASNDFKYALGQVEERADPELYAAILNNAAIARLMVAQSSADYYYIEKMLMDASLVTYGEKSLPVSRAALINLMILDKNGVLKRR